MDTSKEAIRKWLSDHPNRDRAWLAEHCHVEKRTVDNWLSSPQKIPAKALAIIEGLMRADVENEPEPAPVETMDVPIRVTVEQFDAYSAAFHGSECRTLRQWMISRLDAQAAAELAEERKLKVAAPDHPYPNHDAAETA